MNSTFLLFLFTFLIESLVRETHQRHISGTYVEAVRFEFFADEFKIILSVDGDKT